MFLFWPRWSASPLIALALVLGLIRRPYRHWITVAMIRQDWCLPLVVPNTSPMRPRDGMKSNPLFLDIGRLFVRLILLTQPRDSKTCLLYTSPSPRDRQKSRMPSSA